MSKLDNRRESIRSIVRAGEVKTQRQLATLLRDLGFDCTQATVSRDVAEMGLVKSSKGVYMLPEDVRFKRVVEELLVSAEAAGNLVVVKTLPGSAMVVGEALDNGNLPGLVGSVAGDNTIMLAAKTPEAAETITVQLNATRRR